MIEYSGVAGGVTMFAYLLLRSYAIEGVYGKWD